MLFYHSTFSAWVFALILFYVVGSGFANCTPWVLKHNPFVPLVLPVKLFIKPCCLSPNFVLTVTSWGKTHLALAARPCLQNGDGLFFFSQQNFFSLNTQNSLKFYFNFFSQLSVSAETSVRKNLSKGKLYTFKNSLVFSIL